MEKIGVIEGREEFVESSGLLIAKAMVDPSMCIVPVRVVNLSDEDYALHSGSQISEEGVNPCPEKVKTVVEWPRPKTVKEKCTLAYVSNVGGATVFSQGMWAPINHVAPPLNVTLHWWTPCRGLIGGTQES
ncbi:hypothetical protein DPMN_115217 [Dreissena polymorpha]|uniref:Uncharacterized protein n=1 Tax=Dreissena polymorpha TaxID=45954 RepID=A0A9D4QTJ4_DREPO|nr:hypothetical protein DPMN_115217 [Dreissena polymorpha]